MTSINDLKARVIPACAGNTRCPSTCGATSTGHPRVRGEHRSPVAARMPTGGSSPRARGTLRRRILPPRGARVIPACAGNTPGCPAQPFRRAGHPRVRGEHCREPAQSNPVGRVIPACAGNTAQVNEGVRHRPGHPRVRGEHGYKSAINNALAGSSPRARGTRCAASSCAVARRVIPACAGNTSSGEHAHESGTGHPRVRGEHAPLLTIATPSSGSSPRTRGTQLDELVEAARLRVIPACAGNTC